MIVPNKTDLLIAAAFQTLAYIGIVALVVLCMLAAADGIDMTMAARGF